MSFLLNRISTQGWRNKPNPVRATQESQEYTTRCAIRPEYMCIAKECTLRDLSEGYVKAGLENDARQMAEEENNGSEKSGIASLCATRSSYDSGSCLESPVARATVRRK